MMISSF